MKNILVIAFALLTACNSNNSDDQFKDVTKDTSSVSGNNTSMLTVNPGCYGYVVNKDSAFLELTISGNTISGDLSYNLYEKDKNKGTIDGILQDSLLVADYTFQSEGMTSVRQVVFKIHNDSLVEGFGDIEMKGDTARFKNISQLQFQDDRPFTKTDCK